MVEQDAQQISVVIPVGPRPEHGRWLGEALESVKSQLEQGDEIIIVDNGFDPQIRGMNLNYPMRLWASPWPLGTPVAFNVGVGLAWNEHVLLMGSDDLLLSGCLEACRKSIQRISDPYGWYYLGVEYSDGRTQNTPCHASVVTRKLWRLTGGFPPEAAVGQSDKMLMEILNRNKGDKWPGNFYKVSDIPLYWWRIHEDQETWRRLDKWKDLTKKVMDLVADEWEPWR